MQENLIYRIGNSTNNKRLRTALIAEQKGFCAYTEKFIDRIDSVEVEHFNAALKPNDNYYNYYAALRIANSYKKDEEYSGASFFTSLFFQNREELLRRIQFKDGIYVETDPADEEARGLIDFLGLNHPDLYEQRKQHLARLTRYLSFGGVDVSDKAAVSDFFKKPEHRYLLSFITAIESEFQVPLEDLL